MEIKREWVSLDKRWRMIQKECKKFCSTLESSMPALEVQSVICCHQGTWGGAIVEEHGEGENPWPWGKNNSEKEDKREATSLALQATLQGMFTNKDSREEKRRQDKEEKIRDFMDIKNKKLALEAEKKAMMLEIEATEVANRPREVRLTCMTERVKIMKVDLRTSSLRKRSLFEKMQADMHNLDD
ncbi:Helicase SKI2W [Hordeum vulgare]|nr:Helicase SKI2W [Hordeum vulgare]